MNKMIKKRISILLCVVMLLCDNMSIFSFADIVEDNIASESVVKIVDENVEDIKQNDNVKLSSESEPNEDLDIDVDGEDESKGEGKGGENTPEPEDDNVDPDMNTLNNVSSPSELKDDEDDDLLSKTLEDIVEATLSNADSNDDENETIISTKSNIKRNFLLNKKITHVATMSVATISIVSVRAASISEATISDAEMHGLGFIPINSNVPKFKKKKMLFAASSTPKLPIKYDSRASISDAGLPYVPPVRNQGTYGTCWAFASLGIMEISARKKNLVNNEDDSNLSEAALAYLYYHLQNITDSTNTEKPGVEGNDYVTIDDWANRGGNQDMALFAMSTYMGAVKENNDTKYDKMSSMYNRSYTLDKEYAFNNNAFELNNVQFINRADTDVIKKAIMENGAVSISYHEENAVAESGSFSKYDGGKCYYLSNTTQDVANHAVIVVGWDDTIEASKFPNNCAHGNGAWLVRNSWGNGSRDNGYFWLSYNEPSIFETVYSADVIKANTYKYNYHYDTIGCGAAELAYNSSDPTNKQYVGNIFKVSNDEDQSLDAISIGIGSLNTKFDIEIYTKDTNMNDPFDGTLKLKQENYTTTTAGIYTIPLNTKIPFKKNTYYSIVIKPKYSEDESGEINSTAYYIDYTDDSDPIIKFYSNGNAGESFKWSSNAWYDMDGVYSDKTRFCIKGLTNPYTFPSTNPTNTQQTSTKTNDNGNRGGNGGGSGGGGGGGGSIKKTANPLTPITPAAPKQSEAPIVSFKADNTAVISTNAVWSFDPLLNVWSLNPDITNMSAKATSGIYTLMSLDANGNVVNDSYCFDAEGHMMTGWVKDSVGNTYFFNNAQDANIGKMITGWKEIGTGEWYYFSDNGKLTTNGVTADGYMVDAEGKWIK